MTSTTSLAGRLGIEAPLFAFSHCRDVVREVSKAGGIGVLGVNMFGPAELREVLTALERELDGRPYGVDVLYPDAETAGTVGAAVELPAGHKEFMRSLGRRTGLSSDWSQIYDDPALLSAHVNTTRQRTVELLEVCAEFRPAVLVSALRPLPEELIRPFVAAGVLIGGMCGSARHAVAHVRASADFIVAQGAEAGGHTGDIGTMVLTPEVVDAVAPIPVLAAGGIGTGRQMAAALMLGAAGVWTGSVWLGTLESDLEPEVVEMLIAASSADTVKTRVFTGKPCRSLRDGFIGAWNESTAPEPLRMPLQELLIRPLTTRAHATRVTQLMGTPVGQVVGQIRRRQPAAELARSIVTECQEAIERVAASGLTA